MRSGIVKISLPLLVERLFDGYAPISWEIESMHMNKGDGHATVIMTGDEFPEVNDKGEVQECMIIGHREVVRFEVKPIK